MRVCRQGGHMCKNCDLRKTCLKDWTVYKVRVATMTHNHDDTPMLFLMLLVVPAGKWGKL